MSAEKQTEYRFTDHTSSTPNGPDYFTDLLEANLEDRVVFPGRPVVFSAEEAHEGGLSYITEDISVSTSFGLFTLPRGAAVLKMPEITGTEKSVVIPPSHQFPLIRLILGDLYDVVSQVANASPLPTGETLDVYVEREWTQYEEALVIAREEGRPETNTGNYVWDPLTETLYLIPEEEIFKLSLLTSHSFIKDAQGKLSLFQVWQLLEEARVGVLGASVGSNVAEGLFRKLGCELVLADHDYTTVGNVKRIERADLEFLGRSRAARVDTLDPDETPRPLKVAMFARRLLLVNPYASVQVYLEGINDQNTREFLAGLQACVEEVDDFDLKTSIRIAARELGIPILMMTDLDESVGAEWHPYHQENQPLSNFISDREFLEAAEAQRHGASREAWKYVEKLMGRKFMDGPFGDFVEGRGEHATSSLPQDGATGLGAGYLGAWYIARYLLGFDDIPRRAYLEPGQAYNIQR